MRRFWSVSPLLKSKPFSKTLYLSSTVLFMTQLQPAHADPLLGCSSNNGTIVCTQGFPGFATPLNPVLLNGGNILGWNGTASSIRLSNNAAITATMMTQGGTVIGNGSGYNINNVTIDAGSSIDSTGTAISLGSNATININGKVVGSRSMTYGGPLGSGPNIVEFVGNTTVNVGTTGKVIQPSGSDGNSNGEAFNPMGGGNRIINRGLIQTDTAADIWFEGKDTATSSRPNSVENYGTITAGRSGQGEVLGSSGQGTVNFTNFTGGDVNGNIDLNPGMANQVTLYNGSIINGSMTGGGDTASLTLTGQGNDTLGSGVSAFGSLTKAGSGTWTVSSPLSALSNNLTTNINNGTLIVTGNANLNGDATTVGSGGALQLGNNDNGGALSGSTLTNNGVFNINRTDNVTLNQAISGSGTLNQNGSGTTTLTGNSSYSGPTAINAGTLQLGNGGTSGSIASQAITDNGTLAVNRSDNVTLSQAISGSGGLNQNGNGTTTLTGNNSYSGPTAINAGTLQLGNGGTSGSIASQAITDNGTLALNRSDNITLGAAISGSGALNQNGSGTTTLTGNSTYSGPTAINAGTLQLGNGGTSGLIASQAITNNGTLAVNRSDNVTLGAAISGTGGLNQNGSGTTTLTGNSSYSGPTAINAGTLQLGNGGTSGSIASQAITDNGTLAVNRSDTVTLNQAISGSGGLNQNGSGTTTLTGNNSYSGPTAINAGTLQLGNGGKSGSIASQAITDNGTLALNRSDNITLGAAISGSGALNQNGSGTTTLTGNSTYSGPTAINAGTLQLGNGGTSGLIASQAITNNGTLAVNRSDNVTLGAAISGTGGLNQNGSGTTTLTGNSSYSGPTAINAGTLQLGNGGTSGLIASQAITNNGTLAVNRSDNVTLGAAISGTGGLNQNGSGTTTLTGNSTYSGPTAINAGTLQLGNGGTSGSIASQAITDNGTLAVNRSDTVTLNQAISGTGSLNQNGSGTTTLTGNNSYSGPTAINAGTLQLGNGGKSGSIASQAITDNGTLALNRSDNITLGAAISGSGALNQNGSGTTTLTGNSTYSGPTAINAGTLQLGNGGTSGLIASQAITNNGTLAVNRSDNVTLGAAISGTGGLNQNGSGTTTLTGNSSYSGPTAINAGTLQLGNGGTSGSIASQAITDNGTLAVNRSDTVTLNQAISGSGGLNQNGSGTTTLTGNNSYSGPTAINAGTLQLGNGGTSGSIASQAITDNGTLAVNRSDNVTLSQAISGSGGLNQNGSGTTTLTGNNSYSGPTAINKGTLQLGNGGTSGSIASQAITDNGTLALNRSDNVTLGAAISGSGALNQNGSGTTTLTGNSTYSGPTVINAGTLQLGNGGTSGLIASQAITNNGTLAVNRSDNVTLGAAISGTGGLNQNGSGTTTLTGNSTYSGPTAINKGTLQLGNGGTSGSIANSPITDNGVLAINRSDNVLFNQKISGTGALTQNGSGVTTLAANNSYSGPTTINAGTLQLGNGGTTGWITSQPIVNNGTLAINHSDDVVISQLMSGSGAFNQNGPGKITLLADNTYSGPTTINAGILQLGNGGTGGSIASHAITDNGTLAVDRSDNVTLNQAISGSGALNQNGSGTTTLTGNNGYSGPTVINKGTLQLGNGGTSGSIASQAITDNGALTVNRSDDVTLGAVVSGSGALNQNGSGTTILTGNSSYSGPTAINAGTLQLGNGGTSGSIASQAITDNGTLALNRSDDVTLGAAISGTGALNQNGSGTTTLTGNSSYSGPTAINKGTLQLGNGGTSGSIASQAIADNGTLALNRSDDVTLGATISGTGALNQNGSGTTTLTGDSTYSGPTAINAGTLQLGNGGTSGSIASQAITDNGTLALNRSDDVTLGAAISGTGALNQNGLGTTTLTGNNSYSGPTAINAGTLQLGNGGTSGSIASQAITDNGTLTVNRSDDVTLGAVVAGSGALNQNGAGTTTLTGNSTYSGPTAINKGTLQLGNGGTSGSIASQAITDNGTLALNRSDDVTLGAVVSGSGALNQNGAGTTTLTGNNTYSGRTVINKGTLQLGNGGTSGSIASQAIADNGTLALNRSDDVTLGATISGTGGLDQNGSGTTTLTGNNTYSGRTVINKGTLQLGNGGTSGSIASQAIADNGTLALNRSDNVTLGAAISGTGALNQNGSGTTTLTGNNSYSGPTAINAGTLQLGNGGTSGSIASQAITDNGTLALNRSDDVTLGAVVSGKGALNQNGSGTTTLTGNNSYSGPTAINAGTLQLGNGGTSGSIASQAITDNGALTVNRSDDVTLGAVVSGKGALNQNGSGTTTLTGNNSYSGPTAINKGTLQLGNGGTSGSIASQAITDNGTLTLNRSDDVTLGGAISGTGVLNQNGSGTTTLTGNSTYSGPTTINKGTLQLGNGGTSGSIASQAITDNGTLTVNRSDDVTLGAAISGTGGLNQNGSGTTTLTGNNSYSGPTAINKGTLQLGNGGTSGSIASQAITDNGTLVVNRRDDVTLGQTISGTGGLSQNGSGTTILTGANSYNGPTAVNAGTLQIDGQQGEAKGPTTVASQAALAGNGLLGGAVTVNDGGILSPGDGERKTGTLRINGDLNLAQGSTQNWDVGQSYHEGGVYNDLVHVGGNLNLSGTLNVATNLNGTTVKNGALEAGVYRIYTYGGELSGQNNEKIGKVEQPPGISIGVQTSIDHQVNLLVQNTDGLNLWNGGSGGGGVWSGAAGNNNPPSKAMTVFEGGAGDVTVKDHDSAGNPTPVTTGGMQFANNDGKTYTVSGDPIYASQGRTVVRVGDGTHESSGTTAVVNSPIDDSHVPGGTSLDKTDAGKLVLGGDNKYKGDTTITDGTLQLGNGGTTGSIASKNINNNGTLSVNRSDDVKLDQHISGTGGLNQDGTGKTTLTNDNTYTGDTNINHGTLQLGDGGTTGSIASKNINNNGTLSVNRSDDVKLDQHISGTGGLNQDGTGKTTLTNDNTYTGDTNINHGTLQLGDGGTTGSIASKNINNNGTLSVNRSDDVKLDQHISGTGGLNQDGSGKTTLTNDNTYTGDTNINHGTLQLGDGGTTGSIASKNINNNGTLSVNRSDDVKLDQHISGTGGLNQDGTGKTTLTNDNTYTGDTNINHGTLQLGDGGTTGSIKSKNINNNGTLTVNRSDDVKLDQHISGTGGLNQDGSGKTTLTNDNTYTGDTNINHGTLQLGDGGTTGSIASKNINNNGTLSVNRSDDVKLDQHISGTGGLNQDGSGKTTLTNDNTYTGDTNINHGTLQLGDGGTTGSIASKNINNNGTLSVNRSDDVKLDQHISGTGGLNQDGTGKTTLTNDNTYTGDTNINHGTLQLGDGGTTGSIKSKNINNNGTLSVNRSDDVKLDQHISGTGGLNQDGTGKTTLTNDNSYAGPTNVNAGTLQVDGNQSGSHGLTSVASGATLAGNGTIGGDVAVHNGGTLSPGGSLDSAGKMTINGGLSFDPNARQDWNMGQASKEGGQYNDFVNVKGNLQLGGTINISTARGGPDVQDNSLGGGVYRMYSYGGKLSGQDNLNGVMSNGVLDPHLGIQTSIDKQVNLISSHGGELSFWDGSDVAQHGANNRDGNSSVDGGDGVWTAINGSGDYNWTNANGSRNAPWASGSMAIFQGKAGHVTVKDQNVRGQNAPVMLSGMQFANLDNKSYLISGDALHAATANTIIRVGDGTSEGTGITAEVASVIDDGSVAGGTALTKTDSGTLILSGDNQYHGDTRINGGTLQLGNGGTTGSVASKNILDNGDLVINHSNDVALAQKISGTGMFHQIGTGKTTLLNDNSYTGDTTIDHGTLQLGNGGTTGSIAGQAIVNNGALAVNHSNDLTLGQRISGSGDFHQVGTGTTTLTNDNTYQGDTTIDHGTLQLGNGGTTGSIASKNILNNSALAVNHSNDLTLGQRISGTGSFHQVGTGKTVLTNDNSYTGDTTIDHGTLQLGNGGKTGSFASKKIVNNGVFAVNRSNDVALNQLISGTGAFHQVGTGQTTLTNDNTYQGDTTIEHGALQLGDGGSTGSIAGQHIVNNGTLAVNHSNDVTVGQQVSGSGDFHQAGTGKTTLTNDNSYQGTTFVDQGALQFGDGGTTGSVQSGAIVNNGVLAVNRSNDAVFGQNISGTGAFSQDGTGTTVLTNDNHYQGDTTINHGTLQLGNGGETGSIASQNIVNNGTLAVNHSNDVTLGQQISGTGAFHQDGTGRTILTNDNTYTGDTTINHGTLQLGNGGEAGSVASKNIINNGVLSVNRSDDVTLGQQISGSGAFHQDGPGMTMMVADNTYKGDTTVNGGVLQLGDGGTTGAVESKKIVNNGQLIINHSDNVQFDHVISGSGDFIQAGSGRTILKADNTYTGDTIVEPGSSLEIGNGATNGSISASNLINDGTLYINRSDSVLMAQTISGSGNIIANGQGHMTMMTENNTYTGDFHLMSGTIVGSPRSFGTGAVIDDAMLIMNKPGVMKDELRGTGTFVAGGDGVLHLPSNRDDSHFTGQVLVQKGTMKVDGNFQNAKMDVTQGATLSGGGSVGQTHVGQGGTLAATVVDKKDDVQLAQQAAPSLMLRSLFVEEDAAPVAPVVQSAPQEESSPVGVLSVHGDLGMDHDSHLVAQGTTTATGQTMEVNGRSYQQLQSSLIKVIGTAALKGGTVDFNVPEGTKISARQGYTLLTASKGVTGHYDGLNTNLLGTSAFLSPQLAYAADDVDVIMKNNGTSFASIAQTAQQAMIGNALQHMPENSQLVQEMEALNAADARHAMKSLSGEVHASARTALIQDSYYARQAVLDRLDSADCDGSPTSGGMGVADLKTGRKVNACLSNRPVLWGQSYGSLGNNGGNGGASAMHHSTTGFVMGADAPVFATWRVGGLVSYGRSMFNLKGDSNSSGHSNNITIGGYAGNHWGNLHLRLGAAYTWNIMNTRRSVAVGAYNGRMTSGYLGGTAQAFAELGYKFHMRHAVIEPFANVAYVNLHMNGYHEHGGDAALRGHGMDTGVTFSTFGMRASTSFMVGKTVITPQAMFAYRHSFGLRTPSARAMFAGASAGSIETVGAPLSSNSAVLKLGMTAKLTNRIDVGVSYIGQYGTHSVDSGAEGHVRLAF